MSQVFNAATIAAVKIKSLNISDAQFAELIGVGKATISRWFSGIAQPSDSQNRMIKDTVADIEELFRRLHPIRPDLSQPENGRTVLKLLHEKKLWLAIHAVGYEEAFNLTRDEIEFAKTKFEAGVK